MCQSRVGCSLSRFDSNWLICVYNTVYEMLGEHYFRVVCAFRMCALCTCYTSTASISVTINVNESKHESIKRSAPSINPYWMLYGARFIITLHRISAAAIDAVCCFLFCLLESHTTQLKNESVFHNDGDYRRHIRFALYRTEAYWKFILLVFFLLLLRCVYIWYDSLLRSLHTAVA